MDKAVTSADKISRLLANSETPENIIHPYCLKSDDLKINEICFFKINLLTFDEEYPHREAFENVLQSLDNEAFNFVYILSGNESGIELYIGVAKNHNENKPILGKLLNAANYGKNIAGAFEGNFGGSSLEKLTGQNLADSIINSARQFKNAGVIVGIPSVNETNDSKYGFQGIDRLINSMLGAKWRIVVVCEPISKSEIAKIRNEIYQLYNELAPHARQSIQKSTSNNQTRSTGTSESTAKGVNYSNSDSSSDSHGKQNDHSNSSHSDQKSSSYGESTTKTSGSNESTGVSSGSSSAVTLEVANKQAAEIIDYIDRELLERVKIGFSRGFFKTSIYYMGEKPIDAERLKVGIISLFQGNQSSYSPLRAYPLNVERDFKILNSYQSFYIGAENNLPEKLTLESRPHLDSRLGLNTYLTPNEVSLIAGLPQKEIPGITVKESVEFGLNFNQTGGEIILGNLIQKGRELQSIPMKISNDILNKHVFIAGVTGSGKTTTCHKLLKESAVKFLVIEPAKTEYRALINSPHFGNVIVFTVGDELTAPFRLNPFELVRGESVSSHVDMLKATFTSSFPMEASMPQILEEAIYKIYEDKGWDIDTNRNYLIERRADYRQEDEFRAEFDTFPTLTEFLKALEDIVETKGFSDRLRDDYRGSLISRFSNLTKGSKGALFNCKRSIDFEKLINQNVVIEMENLKSAEDKALLMGFILTRLAAVIKRRSKFDKNFRHITLIEEAHRLLSKVELGDGGSKRTAVETFTDLLAEIRKYGESLIIVDQIPNKLAPEVLKNTNTKIIHRLFARDDKESVGDTMMMDDKQKEYLSALETGQAIIFTEGMRRPAHVKIQSVTDTDAGVVENDAVKSQFIKNFGAWYCNLEISRRFNRKLYDLLKKIALEYLDTNSLQAETLTDIFKIKAAIKNFCASFDFKEIDATEVAKYIAAEFTRLKAGDKIFESRLTNFINLMLNDFNLEKISSGDNLKLLINIKRNF